MANSLFDAGRAGFLQGDIDWDANAIKLILVDNNADAPNVTTDSVLSDILAGARIATSTNFINKTTTAGVADADDITLPTVSGATAESIVIFKDTGTEASSLLIAYIDVATGLPVTPNGGDIIIQWDSGANKIFKL